MKYKGKKVSQHRYNQLKTTQENLRKRRELPPIYLHPEALKQFREMCEQN